MKTIFLPVAILLTISHLISSAQEIRISEEKRNFLTYDFSDPDPVARPGKVYPYFRFDGYSDTGFEKDWNIISIKNPYIEVLISPEIGGKILGAFERSTGNTFIYFNNVVKFRDIAQRGAWVSGGIEYNFGSIGHTPASATPVDYVYRKNSDGSYSCFLGGIDLSSRTEWRVEVNVPADKAYFETIVSWYNPTEQNTSLYHWMNASTDVGKDMNYKYPGQYQIDHGGNPYPWPINPDGTDISFYANNNFGADKSYHVIGKYTDFFGTWYSDRNFGSGHWSIYPEKPGKKIWMWSQSRKGAIWVDLLTDIDKGNIQYTEIQTGILFNQAGSNSTNTPYKHLFFAPGTYEKFHELWFPYKNTGGMKEASRYGVINTEIINDSMFYSVCAIAEISGDLIIKSGENEIYRKYLNMKPMDSFSGFIKIDTDKNISVDVANGLIFYSSEEDNKKILNRPVKINREFDWNSIYGLYTSATENAKQRNYRQALNDYEKCLKMDPLYSPALVGAGRIFHRKMDYEKAMGYYKKAMANDTYDPDANFFYAVTSKKLGNYYDALDAYGIAARSMKYRSSAYLGLSEVYFIKGRFSDSEYYAKMSLDYNANQINALKILSILSGKKETSSIAENYLDRILTIDPLNHFANFQRYFISDKKSDLDFARSMIKNELPGETYTELALYYFSIGLIDQSIQILENCPTGPIALYWLSYLSDKKGNQEAEIYLRKAVDMSAKMVFPFREETADVLAWAKQKAPHWKTNYYLALINWNKDNIPEANRLFTACGNQPDFAPFYLCRGNFYSTEYPKTAIRNYEKALDLDPGNWRTYHMLFNSYSGTFDYERALSTSEKAAGLFPGNFISEFDYTRCLLYMKEYDKCIKILDKINILPNEGARTGHDIYRQVFILNALDNMSKGKFRNALKLVEKAREWPENLGVGRPYKVDERPEDFVKAYSLLLSGNKNKSTEIFNNVIKQSEAAEISWNSVTYLHALAYKLTGHSEKAGKILMEWKKSMPGNKIVKWAEFMFRGDMINAEKILSGQTTEKAGTPWNPAGVDPDFKIVYEIAALLTYSQWVPHSES